MPLVIVILLLVIIAILAPGLVLGCLAVVVKILGDVVSSLPWIIGIAVLIAIGMAFTGPRQPKSRRDKRTVRPPGDPPQKAPINPQYTGPGRYRIRGVDRETRMDTVWYCTAQTRDNARAKADLEGIHVTEAEPVEAMDRDPQARRSGSDS